jgi:hypothetical protein
MKIALIAALSAALVGVGAQALPKAIDNAASTDDTLTAPAAKREDRAAERRREDRATERRVERQREARERKREDRQREREARGRDQEAGEDLRGPCDEAEHANDPRCTGAGGRDDAGRGDADRREVEPGDDPGDRRGSNSGPGSTSSGPGPSGEREDDDSHSGSGHGGHDD